MNKQDDSEKIRLEFILPVIYFLSRIGLFISFIPHDFISVGDFGWYYSEAAIKGWAFIDYWVEYPPLFPMLNSAFYKLVGGSEYLMWFLMLVVVSAAGMFALFYFHRIACRLYGYKSGLIRTILYFALLIAHPYTWWYFDLIPVFFLLISIHFMLKRQDEKAGIGIGLGILAKWFPVWTLPAAWRYLPWKRALKITVISLGLTLLVYGTLFIVSPTMTANSIECRVGLSSWQTPWAYIDGNFRLGYFLDINNLSETEIIRYNNGNPAVIPTWLTLLVIGGIGLWLFFRVKNFDDLSMVSFVSLTAVLFLLWSPGWSPQWILYVLPLLLLTLPTRKGLAASLALITVTYLEWPLLLVRRIEEPYWYVVLLRTGMFIWFAVEWAKLTRRQKALSAIDAPQEK